MALRVLLADPDPTLLASYQTRLSQDGFEVSTATNGVDCLEGLHTFRPDVIVLEPEMPWGGRVLSVMHEVFDLPPVPVFIITSQESALRLNLRQFPLVTHVQAKPVRADELVRMIRHIADEPRPRQEDIQKATTRAGKRNTPFRTRNGQTSLLNSTQLSE